MSNTFGKNFRVTTAGESHGGAIAAIVDGCPAGLKISKKDLQIELDRRKVGQSKITTQRRETDEIQIMSGVSQEGVTLGTPILLVSYNKDAKSDDYEHLKDLYRPSHADYTYEAKYGIREWRGGGRSSARETLSRVAAGAIAQIYLRQKGKIEFLSFVEQVGNVVLEKKDFAKITRKKIEANIVRCPNEKKAKEMISLIEQVQKEKDSVGGVVCGLIRNVPAGLGEPVFAKLEADLASAMMSIGATKGFEIGRGFASAEMRGSTHNDEFLIQNKKIRTQTNNAGGILGGISNGEDIYFRVAFKPTATIGKRQKTVTRDKKQVNLEASGRHDPCVVPRAVAIVDAMAALVVMDHYLGR